jgi:hypothetical protein
MKKGKIMALIFGGGNDYGVFSLLRIFPILHLYQNGCIGNVSLFTKRCLYDVIPNDNCISFIKWRKFCTYYTGLNTCAPARSSGVARPYQPPLVSDRRMRDRGTLTKRTSKPGLYWWKSGYLHHSILSEC